MATETTLTGPDFTAGVPLSGVPEAGSLLGHAHGEAVLLVRQGEQLFAVGAHCTHYGAALAQGLLVGTSVRCPMHQACFDLKTGAATAPALNPLPCYQVLRNGNQVTVGAKLEFAAPVSITKPERVLIVGAGPAGATVAETLRRLGHNGTIALLGDEGTSPIDRPNLSKDYLAGNAPEAWLPLRDANFYSVQRIDFRSDAKVTRLDLAARTLELASGEALTWDALVLATGAEAVRLELPGSERVHSLRTLADSRAIIEAASRAKRAVIIGASFIGLEVAASLRARGLEVDIVGREPLPLGRVLGPELGTFVQRLHEAHGVRFHLGRSPQEVTRAHVLLDDGTKLAADLVVAGVGVRPRTELAEQAGLPVSHGILVDAELRAAPGIYAVGDVARWPERRCEQLVRIEHFALAQRQGQAVAHTLLGRRTPFRVAPFFWSTHYDVTLNYVGHAPTWDRLVIDGSLEKRDAAVHYFNQNRLLAVATVGRDRYALQIGRAFEQE